MANADLKCELCSRPLTFVEEVKSQPYGDGRQVIIPLASDIYECPEHGLWRIFISGLRELVKKAE